MHYYLSHVISIVMKQLFRLKFGTVSLIKKLSGKNIAFHLLKLHIICSLKVNIMILRLFEILKIPLNDISWFLFFPFVRCFHWLLQRFKYHLIFRSILLLKFDDFLNVQIERTDYFYELIVLDFVIKLKVAYKG